MNVLFPKCLPLADVYSERIKATLIILGSLSIALMIISPYGWLYACFPRPITAIFLLINRIPLQAFPQPEFGMHYITLLMYVTLAYFGIGFMEHQGIDKPFQKLSYLLSLTILTFFFPFEWIYLFLMDMFHNLPLYNFSAILTFWTVDGILTVFPIVIMYIMKKDLNDIGIKTRVNFDKKSVLLLSLFFISMGLWIIIPTYQNVVGYGTKWFPQTIYVYNDYYKDFGMPNDLSGYNYGIVREYWFQNDLIKYHNHIAKLFGALFMFHTFTLRKVNS